MNAMNRQDFIKALVGAADATVTRLDVTPAALRLRQFALDGKLRLERTFA